jgi:hypothetical protein
MQNETALSEQIIRQAGRRSAHIALAQLHREIFWMSVRQMPCNGAQHVNVFALKALTVLTGILPDGHWSRRKVMNIRSRLFYNGSRRHYRLLLASLHKGRCKRQADVLERVLVMAADSADINRVLLTHEFIAAEKSFFPDLSGLASGHVEPYPHFQ